MRYVLPTSPIVSYYTTLAKMNCQFSTFLTTDTGFMSSIFFSFSSPFLTFLQKYTKRKC